MQEYIEYYKNHKTSAAIWIALLIFWIIGFGYYCSKLDNTVFDGQPFYTEIAPLIHGHHHDEPPNFRPYPSLFVCPGMGGNLSYATSKCDLCGLPNVTAPDFDGNFCSKPQNLPGIYDDTFHCFLYNWNPDYIAKELPESHLTCTFNTDDNTDLLRVYLYDPAWLQLAQHEGHRHPDPRWFPNGLIQRTMKDGTRNLVELARSIYKFQNLPEGAVSYTTLDTESYSNGGNDISFTMYYGNFIEMVYTEGEKVTTGYDFWYWVGFIGGISFLIYIIHATCYGLISLALGWKEEGDGSINYM